MKLRDEHGQVKGEWIAVFIAIGVAFLLLVIVGMYAGLKGMSRYQKRQDALNSVRISTIEIRNQAQRVEIEKQKAEIRVQNAVGVRHAQDEIAKTLTPLYVQFEMVHALRDIAASGRNNSLVFVPSGASGIPLVYDTANATKVGAPKDSEE